MNRVLSALITDDKCSEELRLAYYLLAKEVVQTEVNKLYAKNGFNETFIQFCFSSGENH